MQLTDIIEQGLEGNEIVSLLMWVGEYTTADCLGSPELKIDTHELPPLLEPSVVAELQNSYVTPRRSWATSPIKHLLICVEGDANADCRRNQLTLANYSV